MKKTVAILAMLTALLASGQPAVSATRGENTPLKRCQFNVSWGGCPMSDVLWNSGGIRLGCGWMSQPTLESLYSDWHGNVYTTGNFMASFTYHFKRWFALEASAGFSAAWTEILRDGADIAESRVWGTAHAGVMARFTWVNRRFFRGYSSVGIHAAFGTEMDRTRRALLLPQVDFVGLEFGSSVFGTLAFGLGGEYIGAKVGVGYRF